MGCVVGHIDLQQYDYATVGEWQLQYNKKDLPSFCEVEAFLFNRIAAYEAGEINIGSVAEKKYLRDT